MANLINNHPCKIYFESLSQEISHIIVNSQLGINYISGIRRGPVVSVPGLIPSRGGHGGVPFGEAYFLA